MRICGWFGTRSNSLPDGVVWLIWDGSCIFTRWRYVDDLGRIMHHYQMGVCGWFGTDHTSLLDGCVDDLGFGTSHMGQHDISVLQCPPWSNMLSYTSTCISNIIMFHTCGPWPLCHVLKSSLIWHRPFILALYESYHCIALAIPHEQKKTKLNMLSYFEAPTLIER